MNEIISTREWHPERGVLSFHVEPKQLSAAYYQDGDVSLISRRFDPPLKQVLSGSDEEYLSSAMKNVVNSIGAERGHNDVMKGQAVCCYLDYGTVTRKMTFPKGLEIHREIFEREASRLFAISPDTHYVFSSPYQRHVYVHALPIEPLNILTRTTEKAGFKKQKIGVHDIALAHYLGIKNGVIVYARDSNLSISIILNGRPNLRRVLYIPEESTRPHRFLEEISRTISYYNCVTQKKPLPKTTRIHLNGDVPPNLKDELQEATGYSEITLSDEKFAVNLGLIQQLYLDSPFLFDMQKIKTTPSERALYMILPAVKHGASEINIRDKPDGVSVSCVISGQSHDVVTLPREVYSSLRDVLERKTASGKRSFNYQNHTLTMSEEGDGKIKICVRKSSSEN